MSGRFAVHDSKPFWCQGIEWRHRVFHRRFTSARLLSSVLVMSSQEGSLDLCHLRHVFRWSYQVITNDYIWEANSQLQCIRQLGDHYLWDVEITEVQVYSYSSRISENIFWQSLLTYLFLTKNPCPLLIFIHDSKNWIELNTFPKTKLFTLLSNLIWSRGMKNDCFTPSCCDCMLLIFNHAILWRDYDFSDDFLWQVSLVLISFFFTCSFVRGCSYRTVYDWLNWSPRKELN